MKFRIAAVIILITLSGPALAGFEGGVAAAKRGDYTVAYREFRPLAEAGDPQAQHNLGVMYYNGRGLERNFTEAAKWFRRAAERGVAEAQSSLGYMYQKGEGVTQDYAQSTRWYRKAAEQEFAWAQHSLAAAYAAGEGVRQNMPEAAKWYRKASAQGLEVPAWTKVPSVFTQAAREADPVRLTKTASAEATASGPAPKKVAKEAADKKADKKIARSDPTETKKAPKDAAKKKPRTKTAGVRLTGAGTAPPRTAGKMTPRTHSAPTTPDTSTAPANKAPAASETAGSGAVGTTLGAKKAPLRSALEDTKPKTPGTLIVATDLKPGGKGAGAKPAGTGTIGTKPAGGGLKAAKISGPTTPAATPAGAVPITYAPAAPVAPAQLYDPPATARLVAPSPPPIEAPPRSGSQGPAIESRPKAAPAWRIQIAAVASTKAAKKEWQRIASANDDLLSKLELDIRRADLGARGVFYRVQAGMLKSETEARDVCKALLKRKVNCFVVPVK